MLELPLDSRKKRLIAWFVLHFKNHMLCAAAALLLASYVLGWTKSRPSSSADRTAVFDLLRYPQTFDSKEVCVEGTVLDIRVESDDPTLPYTTLALKEVTPDGKFEIINIISLRLPAVKKNASARACGIFNKVKQVSRDIYYNSILMTSFSLKKN